MEGFNVETGAINLYRFTGRAVNFKTLTSVVVLVVLNPFMGRRYTLSQLLVSLSRHILFIYDAI